MPTRAEGLERAEKVIAESEQVIAECDRLNDHTAREEADAYDLMCRGESKAGNRHWSNGFGEGPSDAPDPPFVWPSSRFQREGKLHLCEKCGRAKPYSEFDYTPNSRVFTGRVCNDCIEHSAPVAVMRRSRYVPGKPSVGRQTAGERA